MVALGRSSQAFSSLWFKTRICGADNAQTMSSHQTLPERHPVDEEWLARGTPIDHIGREERSCPSCKTETVQDHYRAIIGAYAGLGMPRLLRGFAKRQSTAGKLGKKSMWFSCSRCGSFLAQDSAALDVAIGAVGSPLGFLQDPPN